MSQSFVSRFFDALSDRYDAALERCVPRYREMLWALLDYLPSDIEYRSILELGCGTGNLSDLLVRRFPDALIRFVDLSGDSLEACRRRLGTSSQLVFEHQDFRALAYRERSFDLVISGIAVHHLESPDKRRLFANVYRWLRPNGIFAYSDQFAGATADLYDNHLRHWKEQAFEAGTTDEEWQMWMEHQTKHDHHESLPAQLDGLRSAGFSVIDCPWRYLLWTVVQARKVAV